MEEQAPSMNFITCIAWVPRGVAKGVPEKVEIPKEELARIINETKENIKELEEVEEDEYEELEKDAEVEEKKKEELEKGAEVEENSNQELEIDAAEANEEKENEKIGSIQEGKVNEDKKKKKKKKKKKQEQKPNVVEEDEKEFESLYNLNGYDDENDDGMDQLLQLGLLTVHPSNDDDPLFTVKDDEDQDSEDEDHMILPTDNLIAVGHVEEDAAVLEVYVYNEKENCFYVHHDILLPAVPLCMEWLNYDPGDEQLRPGNMLAVGSMSPLIKIWDLDMVDCLESAFTLGKKENKKKKIRGVGHKEAVLSLAWNKHFEHLLASGSVDQTVIMWDLQDGKVGQQIKSIEEKVQSLSWHHSEAHTLLTGACDGKVRMFDCRSTDTCKTWKLDGEIECVVWETDSKPYNCVASTDQGTVFGIDTRQEKPLWTLKAHTKACTAVSMSQKCPGCMVTVSSDESVIIWDIDSGKPQFIESSNPRLGTIQCLAASPDSPFVFCMGGDNKQNNFKVWDIRESDDVRSRFCSRVGLPADNENMDIEEATETRFGKNMYGASRAPHAASTSQETGAKAKPKFGKKKGGHLGWRGKRW